MTAALPVDIAAGTREAVVATWSNGTIRTRYPSARDGSADPAEGFFDALADAQTVIDARGALIGVERRRFAVTVADLLWIDPAAGLPTMRLVDSEQAVDAPMLVARLSLDLAAETTDLELFG
jgi:hypothetical protein